MGYNFNGEHICFNSYYGTDEIINMINYIAEKRYYINGCCTNNSVCIFNAIIWLLYNPDIDMFKIIKSIIDIGYDLELYKNLFLRHAIRNENLDSIQYLIDYGVDIRKVKLILFCAICNNVDILKLLVDNNFELSEEILEYAVSNDLVSIVKYIVSEGIEISDQIIRMVKIIGNPNMLDILIVISHNHHYIFNAIHDK